jgi:hypothetical protein
MAIRSILFAPYNAIPVTRGPERKGHQCTHSPQRGDLLLSKLLRDYMTAVPLGLEEDIQILRYIEGASAPNS